MEIHLVNRDSTNILSISGKFSTSADSEKLKQSLNGINSGTLEIAFLDAPMLPGAVIVTLKQCLQNENFQKLKITVYNRYLSSYLSRLGIRNIYHGSAAFSRYADKKIKALVIGGSAGSLDKIMHILARLPLADVAIFVVQHILEHGQNYLSEILQDKTKYKVCQAEDGQKICSGTVYIAPPAYHTLIEKGHIKLSSGDKINYARPSISLLLDSAAKEYGKALIGVILCGYGYDGSTALELMHQKGSTIIIEAPEECEATEMLNSAWKTGLVDYKFPLPELTSYLCRMLANPEPELTDRELQLFLIAINDKYGYNYQRYEKESIKRRIKHGMQDMGIHSFIRFKELVLTDEDMFEFLFLEFSINVTELFRDPEIYRTIRTEILPYLASFPHIKVWSAGCSTGMEPFSLAITLEEQGLLKKTQLYASDINPYVIEEAKNGLITGESLEKANPKYIAAGGSSKLSAYFEHKSGICELNPAILGKILFFQHSLLNQGSFHEFQLILCRNVLIYFDKELQMQVLNLFARSLDLNGFLVLGKNEAFPTAIPNLKLVDKTHNIYKRIM